MQLAEQEEHGVSQVWSRRKSVSKHGAAMHCVVLRARAHVLALHCTARHSTARHSIRSMPQACSFAPYV